MLIDAYISHQKWQLENHTLFGRGYGLVPRRVYSCYVYLTFRSFLLSFLPPFFLSPLPAFLNRPFFPAFLHCCFHPFISSFMRALYLNWVITSFMSFSLIVHQAKIWVGRNGLSSLLAAKGEPLSPVPFQPMENLHLSTNVNPGSLLQTSIILLMEEILHHPICMNPCK